jgi:signal transduction histidine kinase
MTHDWHKVLCEAIRIVNQGKADFPRSCQDLLDYLKESFELEEAALLVAEHSEDPVSQVFTAAGSLLFPPGRSLESVIDPAVLEKPGRLVRKGQHVQCAAPGSGRHRTILFLSLPPGFPLLPPFEDLVSAVTLDLDGRLEQWRAVEERRWLDLRLELFSELSRKLNQMRTMAKLLPAACCILQNRLGAAGVLVRPLLGGTVHSAPAVHLGAEWKQWGSRMLAVEEKLAARVLETTEFLSCPSESCQEALPEWQGPAVQVLPLRLRQSLWGTLTIFRDPSHLPFSLTFCWNQEVLEGVAAQIAEAMERVAALEELAALSTENSRKLEEVSLLYRISRAIHSTVRLDELMHLVLSVATVHGGAGFERAMLFMANERSGILQGMLGVTREAAPIILPAEFSAWERPEVGEAARESQRQTPFCRQVMKLRLSLEPGDNPLSRAVRDRRVVFVPEPRAESPSFENMTRTLGLAPCACVPLLGRKGTLGVLVVDNPRSGNEITPERRHFLELFAGQAAQAMENGLLLHRLEESHRDLRETQERMIQGEKMAALGETAASVTHELRNPLVAIGGFAQRLTRIAAEGSKEKEYSAIIVREVRRMEEMLTNILGFSKKQMLCIGECRIEAVIEEALSLEEDSLQRSSVAAVCELAENLPVIRGDEQKLRQVLVNLISNARQSMPAGGRLTVRAYPTFLRGDHAVTIEVEDTGGGIPADVMRNIFNPFFTTRENGTGLGLSIVHRIIEHHYGDIEVQNREKGALFIVRLAVDGVPKALPFR